MLLEWVIAQGASLVLKPVGERALSTFTDRVGDRLGEAASDWVNGWVERLVRGDPKDEAQLVAEAAEHPEEIREFGVAVLQERFGLSLPTTTKTHPPGSDGDVLDAYQAVFWRVAATAWWANRPIAIEGALQGEGWLLACYPTGRLEWRANRDDWALPALDDVWSRGEKELWKPAFPAAEFWIKRVPDDATRHALLRQSEDDFKDDGGWPRTEPKEPVEARWLQIDGIHPRWLYLEPDAAAILHISKANDDYKRIVGEEVATPRRWKDYPPEWHPLVRIEDPPAGIAAILAGVNSLAKEDAAFRAAVQQALGAARGSAK